MLIQYKTYKSERTCGLQKYKMPTFFSDNWDGVFTMKAL